MKKYEDIFVKNKNELGKTNVVKHKIDTGNAKPIRQRPYRVIGDKKELIKLIINMFSNFKDFFNLI